MESDVTVAEARAAVEAWLLGDRSARERLLSPARVEAARRERPDLRINDLAVPDHEIVEVDPPDVEVLVNRSHGAWAHRLRFRVETSAAGDARLVPRLEGAFLDPWQERRFLSENFELVFVLLHDEDATIGPNDPTRVARALDVERDLLADFAPTVLSIDDFREEVARVVSPDAREEARRVLTWAQMHGRPVVGYFLRVRPA